MDEKALRMALGPFCAVVVDWLDGTVPENPDHSGPPMPETHELVADLRSANQAGLLTICSQPGRADQRAFLECVATPGQAAHLVSAFVATGLWTSNWALADPPVSVGRVLVTDAEFQSVGTVDAGTVDHDLRGHDRLPDDEAIAGHIRNDVIGLRNNDVAIAACHYLTVTDPVWGRSRLLWDTLAAALTSPGWEPSPVARESTSAA